MASELKNELNAGLVSFATSAAMLREMRDRGHVPPEAAARIIACAIEVVEQIHYTCAPEVVEVREFITEVAEEFGLTVRMPGLERR